MGKEKKEKKRQQHSCEIQKPKIKRHRIRRWHAYLFDRSYVTMTHTHARTDNMHSRGKIRQKWKPIYDIYRCQLMMCRAIRSQSALAAFFISFGRWMLASEMTCCRLKIPTVVVNSFACYLLNAACVHSYMRVTVIYWISHSISPVSIGNFSTYIKMDSNKSSTSCDRPNEKRKQ